MKLSKRIRLIAKQIEKQGIGLKQQAEELVEAINEIESKMSDVDHLLRILEPSLYERWKAYGKAVTNEYIDGRENLYDIRERFENYKEFDIDEIKGILSKLGITDYTITDDGITIPKDKEKEVITALEEAGIPEDFFVETK